MYNVLFPLQIKILCEDSITVIYVNCDSISSRTYLRIHSVGCTECLARSYGIICPMLYWKAFLKPTLINAVFTFIIPQNVAFPAAGGTAEHSESATC